MIVQENVYKMSITALRSKLYLQWTTFVSIKNSSVSQLPFLGNCHGHEREGLGWGWAGQRSRAGCCFLAGILLGIPWGHKQVEHEHTPGFWWLLLPSHGQDSFLQPRGHGVMPMGSGYISHTSLPERCSGTTHNCNQIPQHLDHVAFHTHCTMVVLKKRGGKNRKEPISAFFKVIWKEQRPTQVTQFLERLQSLFLHVFRNTLQIPSWLIARNPALSSNASSHLHSGIVKVPSFSLFLHFNFSRCTSLDN